MSDGTVIAPNGVKMTRETLCLAQHALHYAERAGHVGVRNSDMERIQKMIDDIDRQRPLGPNGKHDNRHTATCGCEDK